MENTQRPSVLDKIVMNEPVGTPRLSFDNLERIELVREEFNGRVGLSPKYIFSDKPKISREQQEKIAQENKLNDYFKNVNNYLRN